MKDDALNLPIMTSLFQKRVKSFVSACFGEHSLSNKHERAKRFAEESIELMQAAQLDRETLLKLVDIVYDKPVGEFNQEVGGVLTTLAALCESHTVDMVSCGLQEINRVEDDDVLEQVREKRALKLL